MDLFASRDLEAETRMRQLGMEGEPSRVLTFDKLLSETDFVSRMRRLLETLHRHYDYPVDVEFTVNFPDDRLPQINLLQCRPLQTRGAGVKVTIPDVDASNVLFQAQGGFMGGSLCQSIERIVYVDSADYLALPLQEKYTLARLVGQVNHQMERSEDARRALPDGELQVEVAPSDEQPDAKRIAVVVRWPGGPEQPDRSVRLVAWKYRTGGE